LAAPEGELMTEAKTQERPTVTVTEQAAAVIKAACAAKNPPVNTVRFSIDQSDNGYVHGIGLQDAPAPDDVVSEQYGLQTVVSPGEVELLNGAEVDYVADGDAGKFVISNPNLH
jgi:iron-sulfur cluster assembly accessory protein